jgi:hypothetical protein
MHLDNNMDIIENKLKQFQSTEGIMLESQLILSAIDQKKQMNLDIKIMVLRLN